MAVIDYVPVAAASLAAAFSGLDLIILAQRRERRIWLRDALKSEYAGWLTISFNMSSIARRTFKKRTAGRDPDLNSLFTTFDKAHVEQNNVLTRIRLWGRRLSRARRKICETSSTSLLT